MKKKVPSKKEIEMKWDEWQSAGPEVIEAVKARNQAMREARLKDATITTRINSIDLEKFKHVANLNGVKYQSFLGQVIHLIANGHVQNLVAMVQPPRVAKKATRKAKAG